MSHDLDAADQHTVKNVATIPMVWTDQQGLAWQVELTDQHVRFQQGDEVFLIPSKAWQTDVSITMHNEDAVLRFETFDKSLVFVLPASKAQPLISHVSKPTTNQIIEQQPSVDESRVQPILWPNVSPLALWALACSALTFIPVVGPLFALATCVLVIRHRRVIRASRTWEHSRVLCRVSVALALVGLVVCALATFSFYTQPKTRSVEQSPTNTKTPASIAVFKSSNTDTQHGPTYETGSSSRHPVKSKYSLATLASFGTTKSKATQSQPVSHDTIAQSGMPWEGDHNWGLILSGLVVLLLSLTVHEAAHAITAWWLGDDFGKRLGRVTLNPLAHIDPIGTVILPLILFMTGAGVFGWAKPVPVRTELLRNPRRDHIFIAAAGPASNILLALISLMLLLGIVCAIGLFAPEATMANLISGAFSTSVKVTGIPAAAVVGAICTVLQLSFILNMFLACFNLIPIPPLDGSWILEHSFPNSLGPIIAKIRPYGFMIFLLAMYTNVLDAVLGFAMYALWPGMWLLVNCPQI